MSIKVNQSDLRKLERKMAELDAITKTNGSAYTLLDRAGLNIVIDIKKPPIPVDTGNLRRSVIYDKFQKAIISQAEYSGFLEFGTRFMKAQPFFFGKINLGLVRLMSDLNNAINRALR
ncbi:MAG: hypothetical protein Unbinned1643contig1000_40 [Prokaryotic dsDNA virus sp.]|nr:MAG: hypothetical protein Unbinned1643contig1000_40 [Prokaryotic dsDNA virus sp.]|tara:strand:- start:1131 stop:1484 length:354 start_codon:yes stop_codon:yes gene_type:complete